MFIRLLSIGCLLFSWAIWAQTVSAQTKVNFTTQPAEYVLGGGGRQIPVYTISKNKPLVLEINLAVPAGGSSYVRIDRIKNTPLGCSGKVTASVGIPVNSGRPCEIAFSGAPNQGSLTGAITLMVQSGLVGGDYNLALIAAGFTEQEFIVRIESADTQLKNPGDCAVRALDKTIFIPQGGVAFAVVDVGIPFSDGKNTDVVLYGETAEGISISRLSYTNTKGSGLLAVFSVNESVKQGVYSLKLLTQLSGASTASGSCEVKVVVDSVLTDLIIEPAKIEVEAGGEKYVQVLAKFKDGHTEEVVGLSQLQVTTPGEIAAYSPGVIRGLQEGSGDIDFLLPDIWSDSGNIVKKSIYTSVVSPQGFNLHIAPDTVMRPGSRVYIPIRFVCSGSFKGGITDIRIDTGQYGKALFAKVVDSKGQDIQALSGCSGEYFLTLYAQETIGPLSADPPFDSPVIVSVSAKGEGLVQDLGFGNGRRAVFTQVSVLRHPTARLTAESPVVAGNPSKLIWESEHAGQCIMSGPGFDNTPVPVNNADGILTLPLHKTESNIITALTCYSGYGGVVVATDNIAVEDKRSIQTTAGTLPGGNLNNSVCRQVMISWPAQSGASGYKVYRSAKLDGADKAVISGSINTTVYTDRDLPEQATVYYWLEVEASGGSKHYFIGGIGTRACKPNLATSDMDIVSLDLLELETVPKACNATSERLQPKEVPIQGTAFTLRINLCNSGYQELTQTKLQLQLSYLTPASDGFAPELEITDANGKVSRRKMSQSEFNLTGTPQSQIFSANALPAIPAKSSLAILLRLEPFLPVPAQQSVYSFTAKAKLEGSYVVDRQDRQTVSSDFLLPQYVFYMLGRSPQKDEQ